MGQILEDSIRSHEKNASVESVLVWKRIIFLSNTRWSTPSIALCL